MNRREQNRALKDIQSFDALLADLKREAPLAIVRGLHDSGIFVSKMKANDPERGTPQPSYDDPTGEMATSEELSDGVTLSVNALAKHLHYARNLTRLILAITPIDVAERARRSIPDCAACGDPIAGKIFYGRWDNKCRQRFAKWVAQGNPPDEKLRFEQTIRNAQDAEHQQ